MLTSNESNIDVIVFGDTEEIEEALNADVDKALPISIISEGLVERLRAEKKPCHRPPVQDSKGKKFSPIGQVNLLWHRKNVPRTNQQKFFVVEMSGKDVIFGADVIPRDNAPDIHTLGLNSQTDGKTPTYVDISIRMPSTDQSFKLRREEAARKSKASRVGQASQG